MIRELTAQQAFQAEFGGNSWGGIPSCRRLGGTGLEACKMKITGKGEGEEEEDGEDGSPEGRRKRVEGIGNQRASEV